MSKEVDPRAIGAVVAIAVVVLGIWVWRAFGTPRTPMVQRQDAIEQEDAAMRRMPRGGAPVGYPSGR